MVNALADDLNTPQALAGLHELANQLRKASGPQAAEQARNRLLAGGWLLGFLHQQPEEYFTTSTSATEASISNEDIDAIIQARQDARKNGDYQLADDLRNELPAAAGIELEDSREGTRWRRL